MNTCKVQGCDNSVSKPDHDFCLTHWKSHRIGVVKQCPTCQSWHENPHNLCHRCASKSHNTDDSPDDSPTGYLSSTRIGKTFGLSNIKTNLILAELGWIEKYNNGWAPTDRGNALGANVKSRKAPFVIWPESILKNSPLLSSIAEQTGRIFTPTSNTKPRDASADFRKKFPATLCAADGHMVRSRAELVIDNWLYMQRINHAYERRLPSRKTATATSTSRAAKASTSNTGGEKPIPNIGIAKPSNKRFISSTNFALSNSVIWRSNDWTMCCRRCCCDLGLKVSKFMYLNSGSCPIL